MGQTEQADFVKGDTWYFPRGHGHVLQNIGNTPCHMLLVFDNGHFSEFGTFDVSDWVSVTPPRVLSRNLNLPESAFDQELFGSGHGTASASGAPDKRPGALEAARGGTLFIDELSELPHAVQSKLIGVLEAGALDVRPIAASQRDPLALVEAGKLRADLRERLAGFTVALPPLRQRRHDVAPLARLFASRASERVGAHATALSEAAVHALEAYAWPGNVTELRSTLERAVAFARDKGHLDPADLMLPDTLGTEERHSTRTPSWSSVTKLTAREWRRLRE